MLILFQIIWNTKDVAHCRMRRKLSFINCYLRDGHINGKNLNIAAVSAKPSLRTIIRTIIIFKN